jgi:hypothetical protein
MSDPRLQSVYLEGQPRRDQFRAARQVLQESCGSQTIAGDLHLLSPDEVDNAPTLTPGARSSRFLFYLKDGSDVFPLHLGQNFVGRLPDNDVVVRDECVSRRHCAILVHSDMRCELHDVASKNGTLLNGKKIGGPTRLQSGDQILLCNRKLTFHVTESPVAEAASA